MSFPPLKPGRALLWITLAPDATVRDRYLALRAVLKQCRLHPQDTTASAQLVIVEEAAFREQQAAAQAALGPADRLHLVTAAGERLRVTVIAPPGAPSDPTARRPAAHRPPWLEDGELV
ncbi:MAG: hypothetical protein JW910_23135 [Anaerolineae bacterium]|nr:hypothetical protein [Anaerolineae bacterium]